MIPLLLITSQTPVKEYIVTTILRETILGIVGGFALGTIARIAWDAADRRRWIDKESRLVWTIALAIFTTGLVRSTRNAVLIPVQPDGVWGALGVLLLRHRDELERALARGCTHRLQQSH